jgi:hypothetical protein
MQDKDLIIAQLREQHLAQSIQIKILEENASERAIRNVKVEQKVSGMFKSGQNAFCNIRSVIDTLIKRQVGLLSCLIQIARIQPE